MSNITSQQFVNKCYPFALQVQEVTGIPAISILAQAALESDWGKKAIGNNIFGIKFRKGDYGYQEVLTTEYSSDRKAFLAICCVNVEPPCFTYPA